MPEEKLEPCFKCQGESAEIKTVHVNRGGGETYQIICPDCGLRSFQESDKERLVQWWNDRPSKETETEGEDFKVSKGGKKK